MNYVKTIGLLAVVAATLMALAGSATASVVTSPPGTTYTGTIKAESEGYVTLHNAVGTMSCVSTIEANVQRHGSNVTAGGGISKLTFTGCTNGSVHLNGEGNVATRGEFEIHALGSGNGTFTSIGARVTVTMFGVECGYTTSTDLGEIKSGTHGTLDIKASIPRTHGSFFCGMTGNLTGSYKITSPTNIAFS